jgi:putative transposase
VFLGAAYLRGRVDGPVVSGAVVVATGVKVKGTARSWAAVGDSDDQVLWSAFLRSLRERADRGAAGDLPITHLGLTTAVARVMIDAAWLRSSVRHPHGGVIPSAASLGWRDGRAGHPGRQEGLGSVTFEAVSSITVADRALDSNDPA